MHFILCCSSSLRNLTFSGTTVKPCPVNSPFSILLNTYCWSEAKSLSRVRLCDPMDYIAHQAPLSMGVSQQEHWSELPFPPPGDLPDPDIKPGSPILQADSVPFEPPGTVVKVNILTNSVSVHIRSRSTSPDRRFRLMFMLSISWSTASAVLQLHNKTRV